VPVSRRDRALASARDAKDQAVDAFDGTTPVQR
jgi:hypothetical protein